MAVDTEEIVDSEEFVERAKGIFAERLEGRVPEYFNRFVEQYFHLYPMEELIGRQWTDVFGCVYQWWQFIQQHDLRRPKIKVFNPNLEEHGWLSEHTVVVILQRDMPFLVDSVRMEFNRRNIAIHTVKSTLLSARRKGEKLLALHDDSKTEDENFGKEALLFLEINLHTDERELLEIAEALGGVLREVEVAVDAYPVLMEQTREAMANLQLAKQVDPEEVQRSRDFLEWMIDGYYTFLGYREYDLCVRNGTEVLVENPDRRMGTNRLSKEPPQELVLDEKNPGIAEFYASPRLLSFAKAPQHSRVHRAAYPDYVIVKRFNEDGQVCGESRFVGLYTSGVYYRTPTIIPIIKDKIRYVLEKSGWDPLGHDGKMLRQVLETFPRDELFQATADQLYDVAVRVAQINERYRVRLFMRRSPYGGFISCIIYVPRDLFSTEVRLKVQDIIGEAVGASEHEFTTYFSESILARVHLVFKVDPDHPQPYDVARLEQRIVSVIRSWEDHLFDSLTENLGEEAGSRYFNQFKGAFPASYQEHYDARTAVHDIQSFIGLEDSRDIALSFYQPVGAAENSVRFKIFNLDKSLELSDVIPVLENLGLRVLGEQPFKIRRTLKGEAHTIWLHDFELQHDLGTSVDVQAVRAHFQEAFAAIWHGQADSDEFNRLVLGARLNWREVVVLRAYAAYMKQTLFTFSQTYIAGTLAQHLDITRNLVALFKARFDPRLHQGRGKSAERIERLQKKIVQGLDQVRNLNEDTIIRRYLDLINGTLRTNFFQTDADGQSKDYLSIKFAPRQIPGIPEPRPMFEIFVYSPSVEGVHLRGGKVARGGLRWSDRLEDYRTEVLGLVKAQQVKNAVIVPDGAKGGFVAKRLRGDFSREQIQNEGIECYRTFIRGLLDITDNLVENKILPPEKVVRVDGDDPYLVVAADKGTASFSDIANRISAEYGHWLGDAFASGGSQGYDHKKMGITARGAWVSVQRHFREKGVDVQSQDFTVVGIGDMAGDVFGNGMLQSEHICLVAAFNHRHIFVDPHPDPKAGFAERQRLFNQPKSSWTDYDASLISAGGGVFSRDAKSIRISPEMKQVFAITEDELTPAALIRGLLKAPVDLVWNGGIGTYVKGARETHAEVGDKSNDTLRVNGSDLRCRVFGEGGNLGMTQLGRVEYCLSGGACNTDFIDNSAGVDCSDHEVNIKILLNELVLNGDLTEKQRNKLLADMTEDVAALVLSNNYLQTQAISLAESQVMQRMGEYRRLIQALEDEGRLDRELEFLPDDDALAERQANEQSLTRPELSVLVSYAKVKMKEELAVPSLTDDDYVAQALERPFPNVLVERYREPLYAHRLRPEIIATQVANDMINNMGITFCHRLAESTGAKSPSVAKAYIAARDIYKLNSFRSQVEALDLEVPAHLQLQLLNSMVRKVRRATRWLLRNRRGSLDPRREIDQFGPVMEELGEAMPDVLRGAAREEWDREYSRLVALGVPAGIAAGAAMPANLYSGLGMVEAARQSGTDVLRAAEVFFLLADRINLHWFANQIAEARVESYWQAMAREAYMDDLEAQLRMLAVAILRLAGDRMPIDKTIDLWLRQQRALVDRWIGMVNELQGGAGGDFAMYSVALRELLDLAQTTQHIESLEAPEGEEPQDEPQEDIRRAGAG
ncbi:NAD-glutamate dehydrogenase [Gilvimarinus sp. F26214L]|uniref:NAD-glutamate dehydrogenase n=1 Tax=Gilvimarinus sp. DZF01 TaxID=3461371 RepID=UPI004045F0E6